MNAHKTALARVVLTFLAGILFFSSWALPSRMALPPAGALSYPQLKAFQSAVGAPVTPKSDWKKIPAADKRAQSAQMKLLLERRLATAVQEPALIKKADVEAARAAWGRDASKMLDLLRQSAD